MPTTENTEQRVPRDFAAYKKIIAAVPTLPSLYAAMYGDRLERQGYYPMHLVDEVSRCEEPGGNYAIWTDAGLYIFEGVLEKLILSGGSEVVNAVKSAVTAEELRSAHISLGRRPKLPIAK